MIEDHRELRKRALLDSEDSSKEGWFDEEEWDLSSREMKEGWEEYKKINLSARATPAYFSPRGNLLDTLPPFSEDPSLKGKLTISGDSLVYREKGKVYSCPVLGECNYDRLLKSAEFLYRQVKPGWFRKLFS